MKTHWYWQHENGSDKVYTPCGRDRRENINIISVPVQEFEKIPVEKKCKSCLQAYDLHKSVMIDINTVYHLHYKVVMQHYYLILYRNYIGYSYKRVKVKYIIWDEALNYIKICERHWDLSKLKRFKRLDINPEKINYIKRLGKLILA